ncbi:SUKH-4 family immunity protein [Streptomyces sp. NPDC048248]|uniref:SUKH-4 family immunity protein n=1 Tax=Streptomyces sp. NPDC048248 TaxID=3365523 RepID=UPI00371D671A
MGELAGAVLDDPARLLAAGRAEVREHIEGMTAEHHMGREVFQQAEAMFGGAEVSRAEFASWLQFAAKVLGHDTYAERIAAAETGMPWRTVWAWWRPMGRFDAHPNRLMDSGACRYVHEGRELIEVGTLGGPVWLDLETGARVPPPAQGTAQPVKGPRPGDGEADYLSVLELSVPEDWAESTPVPGGDDRMRYLVDGDAHGIALLETDPATFRDWPRGEMDHSSAEAGTPGRMPAFAAPTGPLTAERVDAAFAPFDVRRIPAEQLPGALKHPPSRRHLRDIGLPLGWVCGWESIDLLPADALTTPEDDALQGVRLPQGTQVADLLSLGTSEHGDLFLHRRDGTVFIALAAQGQDGHSWEAIEIAPDLDIFTRYLEGIRRYTNACWYPYPDEEMAAEVFTAEMDALAPGFFAPETRSGEMWSYFYAGITELSEYGY